MVTELVDVHSHFLTEQYIAAASRAGHRRPEGMPAWAQWSPADHLALMDQVGVRASVLSLSAPGTHFGDDAAARGLTRHVNEYAHRLVERHPDRFGQFASLPLPDVDGALAELAHVSDVLGCDGIAMLSNAGGVYPGDPRYRDLHAELDRRAAIVFVHPVSPPNWQAVAPRAPRPMLEYVFDSARAACDLVMRGVLTRYPNITWVFSHSGGALPLLVERIQLFRDVFLAAEPAAETGADPGAGGGQQPSVAALLGLLWYDIAGTPFPNAVPALVRAFGHRRVLYGSDYCWTPRAAVLAQVASIDAATPPSGGTWRELTTANCARLLPRLAAG